MKILLAIVFSLVLTMAVGGHSLAADVSTEEIEQGNMEIIRKTHADLANGDFEAFKSAISPNYTRHCQAMPPGLQELHGTKEFFAFIEEFMKAAPGYTDSLSNMIAMGDRVAYISTISGTQTGPMGGFPATGKTFNLVNIIMQRLEDGKVVETWVSWDNVSFLSQLGLMPGPKVGTD